jgi:threonine/homoserine/homoserine lactone efflux protein
MITAFVIASLALAVTPGPAVIYLLTRTIAHGRRAGFASLAGVALGNFGNALGASLGLAALFAVSSFAFTVVKFGGALYLIYLGVRALLSQPVSSPLQRPVAPAAWPVFRDGFLVALLNPKTALFFAAFLPQFIDPSGSAILQSVLLGTLFVLIAASTDVIYVLVAARALPVLAAAGRAAGSAGGLQGRVRGLARFGRYLSASTFFGLGIYTALAGPRAGK